MQQAFTCRGAFWDVFSYNGPSTPHFPIRVLVSDTLLKELPRHPRWWNHFIAEYTHVFGDAIGEIIEDLSHPLQKVNVKGDDPFRHDWDCPYYVTSMTDALADLVLSDPELILKGSLQEIHYEMKKLMQDYYTPDLVIKDRQDIKLINRSKRWNSGQVLINELMLEDWPCPLAIVKSGTMTSVSFSSAVLKK